MLGAFLRGATAQQEVEVHNSTFLANQASDGSRSLLLATLAPTMLVAMTGNRTGTPPALLSGYTNIGSVVSQSGLRSLRLQYKLASAGFHTISWTGSYGYLISLRYATRIGQFGFLSTAGSNTVALPDITGLNTIGAGFVLAGSYPVDIYTSVSSPYSLLVSGSTNIAAQVPNNTNESLVSKTITASTSFASSYAVEFLP